jgi:hypothetical protein
MELAGLEPATSWGAISDRIGVTRLYPASLSGFARVWSDREAG